MFRLIIIIISISSLPHAWSDENNPSPILGDSLNRAITLSDEKKIGSNIYKNLQKNSYVVNDVLVSDYISYLGNKLSRNISQNRDYVFL